MTNRYHAKPDPEKPLPGRPYIGPVVSQRDRDRKRISNFIFDGPDGSPVAKLKTAYLAGLAAVDTLRAKREQTEATRRFTSLGVTETLGEVAMTESLPALRRARAAVDKVKAEIAEKAGSLTLSKPSDEQRKEHEEIRAAMRGMTPVQRDEFLKANRHVPNVAAAIAGGIPALSGVSAVVHQNIVAELIEKEHGETISELRDLEEVVQVTDKVVTLARDELRETIGCTKDIFETIAKVGEAGNGEMPFRVETQIVDGGTVDVCRVYDFEARRWRDAKPEEIASVAA